MAKREVGEFWNCSACGKALVGARTIHGKVAPIEVDTNPQGTCFLYRVDSEVRVAVIDANEECNAWVNRHGMERRMNHFATCPHRERFRQRADSGQQTSDEGSTVTT